MSLMISDDEHFFMHLLAVCMSSLEKHLFGSSARNQIGFLATELYEFFKYFGC